MIIDSTPVCLDCVQTIIPKFHAAAQYEVNYPVEWSANLTLNPQDFAEFFDDFPGFLNKWTEREREYKTSGKDRLYCQGCSGYVGDRTMFLFKIALCPQCKIWICSRCGSKDKDSAHECQSDANDEDSEALGGCKRCPGCSTPVVLEDGCNEVTCAACRSRHCYVCQEMDPKPDHWSKSRGGTCPRFNAAGAENALFNEDIDLAEGQQQTVAEALLDLLRWDLTADRQIATLTALPPAWGDPPRDLEIVQTGIMNEHRTIMQSIADSGEGLRQDLQLAGALERNPDMPERLREVTSKLAINVDLYVASPQIREAHADYSRRHEHIINFIGHMPRELIFFWPAMYSAFLVYRHVAPAKLAAARPRRNALV